MRCFKSRLNYLVLRNSYKVFFQFSIYYIPSELLTLLCGRKILHNAYLFCSSVIFRVYFSLINELVVCTCRILLVLTSESIALRRFVHLWSTRGSITMSWLLFYFLILLVLILVRFFILLSCVIIDQYFIEVHPLVVHLIIVSKLFDWLLKLKMFLVLAKFYGLGWKFYIGIFVSLVCLCLRFANRSRANWIFIFS